MHTVRFPVAEPEHRNWWTGMVSSRTISHSPWIKRDSPWASKTVHAFVKRNWKRNVRNEWIDYRMAEMNCGRASYRSRKKVQSNQWQKLRHEFIAYFGFMVNPLLQVRENVHFRHRQVVSFQNCTKMAFVQFQNVVLRNFVDIFGQPLQCMCSQTSECGFLSNLKCAHTGCDRQFLSQKSHTLFFKRWNAHSDILPTFSSSISMCPE